ncbi:MAG: glycosyltransferase, partial [Candidatus Omnitrophica bacterium]|nr:glycosyltransferase [Candidatus Omnitrophota bacterium]
SATSAEGFGIPHLESMVVGLPQIVPGYSVFPEFITGGDEGDRGLLCDVTEQLTITGQSRALVDISDMVKNMDQLYFNIDKQKRMSKNAIKWATKHTCDQKCAEWDELLSKQGKNANQ